jgi:type III secretion system FlhB-like substrate exporter
MSQKPERIKKVTVFTQEELIEILKNYKQATVIRKELYWIVSYVLAV